MFGRSCRSWGIFTTAVPEIPRHRPNIAAHRFRPRRRMPSNDRDRAEGNPGFSGRSQPGAQPGHPFTLFEQGDLSPRIDLNASDAAEKLRFEALSNDALYEGDSALRIRVTVDSEAGTVTILDNGIGMSRQEVNDTIGTIASSGTRKFLENLSGDKARTAS